MSDITSRVNAIIVDKLGVDENEVVPSRTITKKTMLIILLAILKKQLTGLDASCY